MDLDACGVQRDGFDPDTHDLRTLQLLEHAIQDASFGPAIHARVNRVPVAEAFGQSAPLATMFGHIEDRIDHLQIAQADVATLPGQAVFNGSELFGRDLHVGDFLAQSSPSPLVLTRPSVRGYRTGENPTRWQGFDQHATRPIQTNYPGASHATIPTHRRWRAFGQRFRRLGLPSERMASLAEAFNLMVLPTLQQLDAVNTGEIQRNRQYATPSRLCW